MEQGADAARSPFVGRESETAFLSRAVDDALAGRARLILVEGPAGIGKTRLVTEAADSARALGFVSVAGRCFEGTSVPWLPLIDALGVTPADPGDVETAELLHRMKSLLGGADDSVADPAVAGDYGGARTVKGVVDALLDLARLRPMFVALDDLQWADPQTLEAVTYLSFRLGALWDSGGAQLMVVGTNRNDRLGSTRSFDRIGTDRATAVMPLTPLASEHSAALMRELAPDRLDRGVVHHIADLAMGNPLYVEIVIRQLADAGFFDLARTLTRDDMLRAVQLPPDLSTAVVERLRRLGDGCRMILEALAIAAEEASVDALAADVGVDIHTARDAIDEAVRAGVVAQSSRGCTFSHPALRHATLIQTARRDAARLHARAARRLAANGADPIVVAEHLLSAEGEADAEERRLGVLAGAEHATSIWSWEQAARLYDALIDAQDAADDARVRLASGRAHIWANQLDSATVHLKEATSLARRDGDVATEVDALTAIVRTQLALSEFGAPIDVDALADSIDRIGEHDAVLAALALGEVAYARWGSGMLDDARASAFGALDLVADSDDARTADAVARANISLGLVGMVSLDLDGALASFQAARAALGPGAKPHVAIGSISRVPIVHALAGRLESAEQSAIDVEREADAHGVPPDAEFAVLARMSVAYLRGNFALGDYYAERAAALAAMARSSWSAPAVALLRECATRASLGDARGFREALDVFMPVPARVAAESVPGLRAILGYLAAESGDLERAARLTTDDLAPGIGGDAPMYRLAYAGALVEAATAVGKPELAATCLELLETARAGGVVVALGTCLHVERLVGLALAGAGRTEEAVRSLEAAVEQARDRGMVVEHARALLDLAALVHGPRRHELIDASTQIMREYGLRGLWWRLSRVEPDIAARHRDGLEPAPAELEKPVGELAVGTFAVVMFVDVVGSTSSTDELGTIGYLALQNRVEATIRRAIEVRGGLPIPGITLGDGILAVFTDADDALDAAFSALDETADMGLGLHIGMHAGPVLHEEDRLHGGVVNYAARVCDRAKSAEVLITPEVVDLIGRGDDIVLADRGMHVMKNVATPLRLWQVSRARRAPATLPPAGHPARPQ